MGQMQHLHEIKRRAERVGLSLRGLCREAQVSAASVSRWLADEDANPQLRTLERAAEQLERALVRHERDLARELIALHPDVAQRAAA